MLSRTDISGRESSVDGDGEFVSENVGGLVTHGGVNSWGGNERFLEYTLR